MTRKYHHYRVWVGDGNDHRELTNYWFPGSGRSLGEKLVKAIDMDHAIKQVFRDYIGKENWDTWEDNNEGDDRIAILDSTEQRHYEDCEGGDECDCDIASDYIMIEEV